MFCIRCGKLSYDDQDLCDECYFQSDNTLDCEPYPPIFWIALGGGIVAFVMLIVLLLFPSPAKAETLGFRNPIVAQERATCANVLLGVQLADAYTTRVILSKGGYERDPWLRPLVSSNIGAYGSAVAINILARLLTRHSQSLMCVAAGVESLAVANNIRVLEKMK